MCVHVRVHRHMYLRECRLNTCVSLAFYLFISNHFHQLVLSAIGFSRCSSSTNHAISLPMCYTTLNDCFVAKCTVFNSIHYMKR